MTKPVEGHVVFCCKASLEIGSGHVMRCLSFARYLFSKNFKVTFLTSEESVETVPALKCSNFQKVFEWSGEIVDWLIIDDYDLDKSYHSKAREWAKYIFVIDDLADKKYDCDVILNQTYGFSETEYSERASAHLMVGSEYAILNDSFRIERKKLKVKEGEAKNILICFGGVNPKQATEKAIDYLAQYKEKKLNIVVCASGGEDNLKSIRLAIESENFHNIVPHENATNMPELMAKSDLCIGSGGTMSWERCCMKLPTITLELADNQKHVLRLLHEKGAIKNLGKIEDVSEDNFLEIFSELVDDSEGLKHMRDIASLVCDGRGLDRVVPFLVQNSESKDKQNVSLRMASMEDCEIIYNWQVEEGARQFSRQSEPPTLERHIEWFKQSLLNDERFMYVVYLGDKPCGVARLDQSTFKEADLAYEVSILISQKYQSLGIGRAVLEQLAKMMPENPLIAYIQPENLKSIELFSKAGYKKAKQDWYVLQ